MKLPINSVPISLDELPSYTDWIPFLLGLKSFPRSLNKSADSIQREYGDEKWGELLKYLTANKSLTILDADKITTKGSHQTAFYADGSIYIADSLSVQELYFSLISGQLQPHIKNAGHLVELGAGYGSQVLKIAAIPGLECIGYTAAEFTETGIECIDTLAQRQKIKVQTGYCDLNSLDLECFNIPSNAVFMTAWTMACLKGFPRKSINAIIKSCPSLVVHIEPIYEHWTEASLLQLMWRKYFQLNDYNQTLLSDLKIYESEGLIKIVEESCNIFGTNPLAPVSVVKWVPCG